MKGLLPIARAGVAVHHRCRNSATPVASSLRPVTSSSSSYRAPPPRFASSAPPRPPPMLIHVRSFVTSTTPTPMGLDEFRDTASAETRMTESVGRSWTVKELRRKSFHDLHKLWYVLYKEKNMLLTEANLARRKGFVFPQPERRQKVKKSMGAIKAVLGERKRDKIAQHALRMNQMQEVDPDEEEEQVEEGEKDKV